ncbi:DUF4064 domain-containing protein [Lysinibacillus telephonicus]|uniref:DUF4064 domain-containing protein n=1 Tax=Lysinibacillus telephonicus TaxID=1714840 RepID=A0A3S0J3M1_9BACI|nr:DUF4064 domain-containing protein [Lysinibacillus telephonicus]RTQ93462.1 DUF4064 domain-containing protein [Lysinibacillus telephonicus]
MIKRTAEKVLGIISVVLNLLSIGMIVLMIFGSNLLVNDPLFESEIERSMYGTGLTDAEIQEGVTFTQDFIMIISNLGWIFVVFGVISIILAIVGAVKVNGNPKLAGILFIIGAVTSGVVSLPGILLIIAGILCFARKPKIAAPIQQTDENGYIV